MRMLRTTLAVALALALAGCISLFPKTAPIQLYRFAVAPAPQPHAPGAFAVQRFASGFTFASEGDRILTIDGGEAAYIAGARWEAPAATLFDDAETQAFENAGGRARLLHMGDAAAAPYSLRLDVERFEARYEAGPKAPPTVVVSVRALLVSTEDRKVVGDEVFESRQPAADNRVGAIVDAYSAAASDVLGRIAVWTDHLGS